MSASNGWTRLLPAGNRVHNALLLLAVGCQFAAVIITWPLWQTRISPVNLPLHLSLPTWSFGWAMILSLVAAALVPRIGVPVHWIVLATACVFDQFRMQPQFLGLAVLMLAYFGDGWLRLCRWYLVVMWIWAGLHKLLSPAWMGFGSWTLVKQAGFDPQHTYLAFAVLVAVTEIALGLLACFRPRQASWLCLFVHLGIVVFLSPLLANMNDSVIPWNIGVAIIGFYVLREVRLTLPARLHRWEGPVLAILLLVPVGFYFGWVDRFFCHVMYSGNQPEALLITKTGTQEVVGWGKLGVPFPGDRRLFRLHFRRVAEPGDKMHIRDSRAMLADQFLVMRSSGPQSIGVDEFFRMNPDEVMGVGLDQKQSLFHLSQAGIRMLKESEDAGVYAVAFTPSNFDRQLLKYLKGLPNIRQIQLSGTSVQDDDLRHLKSLRMLTGLGLNDTQITDQGLNELNELPYLQYVESEGTTIRNSPSDGPSR